MVEENKISWICKYCGEDTSNVEADYLAGIDHLQCVLKETFSNGLQFENRYPVYNLTVPYSLIEETSNDQELGERVRLMYHEAKNLR